MTKAELIADLKSLIGPGNAISDSTLLVWINSAYLSMCDEISKVNPDYFTKDATTDSVNTNREYSLPTDFEKMIKVEIQQGSTWYRVQPLANIGTIRETSSGIDDRSILNVSYYITGNVLGFTPVPTETTSDTIKIWYVYTPTDLTEDSDEPAFPRKYHHTIALGAYADFLDSDEEHTAAENMRRRFDKRNEDMAENLAEYQVDQPKSVQVVGNTYMYQDQDWI